MKKGDNKVTTLLLLIGNFIAFFELYIVGMNLNATVTFIIYGVVLAGFSFTYVIYNRGFSRRRVTYEMLPMDWSEEEKTEFIEDGKRRMKKSKWMLTVIIPLVAIYAYEVIDIYIVPLITSMFH